MAVITVNIGPKRVALTAYCPDDELGLAACDYVLNKVRDMVQDGVSEEELWKYLMEKDDKWKFIKTALDNGWELRKNPPLSINPSNHGAEMRIVDYLRQEQYLQRRFR